MMELPKWIKDDPLYAEAFELGVTKARLEQARTGLETILRLCQSKISSPSKLQGIAKEAESSLRLSR